MCLENAYLGVKSVLVFNLSGKCRGMLLLERALVLEVIIMIIMAVNVILKSHSK